MVNVKPNIVDWTCQGCWTTYDTENEAEVCCSDVSKQEGVQE